MDGRVHAVGERVVDGKARAAVADVTPLVAQFLFSPPFCPPIGEPNLNRNLQFVYAAKH